MESQKKRKKKEKKKTWNKPQRFIFLRYTDCLRKDSRLKPKPKRKKKKEKNLQRRSRTETGRPLDYYSLSPYTLPSFQSDLTACGSRKFPVSTVLQEATCALASASTRNRQDIYTLPYIRLPSRVKRCFHRALCTLICPGIAPRSANRCLHSIEAVTVFVIVTLATLPWIGSWLSNSQQQSAVDAQSNRLLFACDCSLEIKNPRVRVDGWFVEFGVVV